MEGHYEIKEDGTIYYTTEVKLSKEEFEWFVRFMEEKQQERLNGYGLQEDIPISEETKRELQEYATKAYLMQKWIAKEVGRNFIDQVLCARRR